MALPNPLTGCDAMTSFSLTSATLKRPGEERIMANSNTRCRIIATISAASLLAFGLPRIASAAKFSFLAVLNSGQEIQTPKPNSNAQGTALMTFDTKTGLLCYSISYLDLIGTETAAHFHAPASAGQNAPILFPISPDISPVGSPKTGCVGPVTGGNISALKRGLFYINIHSNEFPAGEIRGQVFRMIDARTKGQVAE